VAPGAIFYANKIGSALGKSVEGFIEAGPQEKPRKQAGPSCCVMKRAV
jgi:hypothetical protein